MFKIKGKFFVHGTLMLVTVICAIASFLWFMSVKASTFTDYLTQLFNSTLNFSLFLIQVVQYLGSVPMRRPNTK